MSTIAQEALAAHLIYQKQHWSTMSTTQKDAWIRTREDLELSADSEIAANEAEELVATQQAAIDQRAEIISELITKGYAGDGSLSDYIRLFNHPEFEGGNWEQHAIDAHQVSLGIDSFITLWIEKNKR